MAAAPSFAQTFTVFDENPSEYPRVSAKFYALDSAGRPLPRLSAQQFVITEDGTPRIIKELIWPEPQPLQPISAVLALDVSGSMVDKNRIDIAKAAATAWVDAMQFDNSECAVVSFDDKSYCNQDFTSDRDRLYSAIARMRPQDGTSYTNGFLSSPGGALWIGRRAKHKRIIVFLTDGLGGGSEDAIAQMAQRDSATVYCIALGMPAPRVLKRVAQRTGGMWYERVTETEELTKIYRTILHQVQKTPVGEIIWESSPSCNLQREVRITLTHEQSTIADKLVYAAPPSAQIRLATTPRAVRFRDIPPGASQGVNITLTAQNLPITVTNIESNNPAFFVGKLDLPFTLNAGEKRTVLVGFAPRDSLRQAGRIDIRTNACAPSSVFLSGGYLGKAAQPTFALTAPNGGETLYVGADTLITWTGLAPSDPIKIEYNTKSGSVADNTWQVADTFAVGLKRAWQVPPIPVRDTAGRPTRSASVRLRAAQTWDAANISEIPSMTLEGHSGSIFHAEFSRDGNRIVTASADGTARIWDANTGFTMFVLPHGRTAVRMASFSNDGTKLVTVSEDNSIRLWDAETGAYLRGVTPVGTERDFTGSSIFDGLRGVGTRGTAIPRKVFSAVFDPQDRFIISALENGVIVMWFASSLSPQRVLASEGGVVYSVLPSGTGKTLLTATSAAVAQHRSLNDNTGIDINGRGNYSMPLVQGVLQTFRGHADEVVYAAFSTDESRVITASMDKTARVWDIKTGKQLVRLTGHTATVWSAQFSPDGTRAITAGADGTLRLWDAETGKQLAVLDLNVLNPEKAAKKYVKGNQQINLNVAPNGKMQNLQALIDQLMGGAHFAQFSPDASRIVACGVDINAFVWEISGGFPQRDSTDAPFTIIAPLAQTLEQVSMPPVRVGEQKDTLLAFGVVNTDKSFVRVQDIRFVEFVEGTRANVNQASMGQASVSQDFTLVSGIPPFDVAAGTTASLEVRFAPSTTGTRSAVMEVITLTDTLRTALHGEGRSREYHIETPLVEFPPTSVRLQRDTTLALLTNTGTLPLVVRSMSRIRPDTAQFQVVAMPNLVVPNFPLTLQPGETLSLTARFAPRFAGRTSGGVAFTLDGYTRPAVVQFSGEGTAQPLTASMLADGMSDTLKMQEQRAFTTRPLLNFVFFDDNTATLPARYNLLTPAQAPFFAAERDEAVRQGGLQAYHQILNIIGAYLAAHPQATVRLVGCNADAGAEKANAALSKKRAEAVRDYWRGVWGIADKRIKIQARNKPDRPSNNSTEDGLAENRRVEIIFDAPDHASAAFTPILADEAFVSSQPERVAFRLGASSEYGVAAWRAALLWNGATLKEWRGVGAPPSRVEWTPGHEPATLQRLSDNARGALTYTLWAADSARQTTRSERGALPFAFKRSASTNLNNPNNLNNSTAPNSLANTASTAPELAAERFSLMFFDFDKTTLNPQNARLVERIKSRLQKGTALAVTGYTDRVGDDEYNRKLSEDRATAVADALRLSTNRTAAVRGAGEITTLFDNNLPEGRFYCRMVEVTLFQPSDRP
jgi:WD40 repeat protein/outer membrane protein OmpA-like peptidoglycan-associated protein